MKTRWKEYIEDLYNKGEKLRLEGFPIEDEGQIGYDERGPNLLMEEICAAMTELKSGKAAGVDDIPAEFLKLLD